ncbi:MAG: biotin/lipoyl-binding protein [bacterium]|nr:biotin/lipoyl-binding protein [bacterium]
MKTRIPRTPAILATIAVLTIAAFAVRFNALSSAEAPASLESTQAASGKPVELVAADRGDRERWLPLAGTVEGVVQYAVTSTNALRITAINVHEGDKVRAGDVIVRLAREAPTPMVHSYARARANHENLVKDVQRLRALHAQGAISDQALDQAETRLKVAAAELQDVEGSTSLVATQDGIVAGIVANTGDVAGGRQAPGLDRADRRREGPLHRRQPAGARTGRGPAGGVGRARRLPASGRSRAPRPACRPEDPSPGREALFANRRTARARPAGLDPACAPARAPTWSACRPRRSSTATPCSWWAPTTWPASARSRSAPATPTSSRSRRAWTPASRSCASGRAG